MERRRNQSLKAKLRKNVFSLGSWINLAHPAIPEIMADAGFDWLAVDLEHSVITIREAEELIRIIDLKGLAALVRLTSNDPHQIKRVMDAGASGIIVPMVNSKAQAEAAVRAVRYPPEGTRGVGLARAQAYGADFAEYVQSVGKEAVVIAQIEHIDAINDLEAIVSVPGLDGTMIGPYDLSASLGKAGKFDDPEVVAAVKRYELVSRRSGKPMGYHVIGPQGDEVRRRRDRGYAFVAYNADFLFLQYSCRDHLRRLGRAKGGGN